VELRNRHHGGPYKRKTTQRKTTLKSYKEKEPLLVLGAVTLPHQRKEKQINEDQQVAGLAYNWLLMRAGNGNGEGTIRKINNSRTPFSFLLSI
jgi:hypothetical protein